MEVGSEVTRRLDAAAGGGVGETPVIAVVDVGVGLGEVGDRVVESRRRAEVPGDGDAIAGPCVRPGEAPRAELAVGLQPVRTELDDLDRALPVPQLAHVEV